MRRVYQSICKKSARLEQDFGLKPLRVRQGAAELNPNRYSGNRTVVHPMLRLRQQQ
jgi:hypothetical protein